MADTSKYIERAETEVKRRNYDMAMDLYHEILQIDPNAGQARAGMRRAALKKLEKKYPSPLTTGILNLPVNLMLALSSLFRSKLWTVNLCESALRRDPRNAKLNQKLGEALLDLGHGDSALAAFRVVTEFDTRNSTALKTLGRLLYERKDLEESLACYEKALKINPRDQEANKMRKNLAAEGAIRKGGFEQASSARDLAKSGRQLQEAERAQRIVRSSQDIKQAISELEEALEATPDSAKLLSQLASLRLQNHDLDQAVDLLLRVTQLDPQDHTASERLGDARIRRLELRIAETEKEHKSGQKGAEARLDRHREDLIQLQIEEFERRVDQHPTDMSLRFRLGQANFKAGHTDEAIEQFQKAIKDPRHRVPSLHLLGRAFARKGMVDLAVKQLEQAASSLSGMGSQRKDILYDLALVCQKSGSTAQALDTFKLIFEADISYRDVSTRIEALSDQGMV